MVDKKASNLHLMVGSPPVLRIDGEMVPQLHMPSLRAEDLQAVFEHLTTQEQRRRFVKEPDMDFPYTLPGLSRFRVSVLRQRGTLALAFRLVPDNIPTIEELGLPQVCKELALKPRGLILVSGPAGSGKSTTVAAMINYLNKTARRNIITIEDPIEFLHRNRKSLIAQRDVGVDTSSFDVALTHALRQDPDVIFVGEMRDLTTMATAIRAAETGHLVISTLHTAYAAQSINRIIDVFPPIQQEQIRVQLAQTLEAVLVQCLLPRLDGGRGVAFVILHVTPAVRNLIRTGRTHELPNVIQLSHQDGMQTMDQALAELVKNQIISRDVALAKSSDPKNLNRLLQFTKVD